MLFVGQSGIETVKTASGGLSSELTVAMAIAIAIGVVVVVTVIVSGVVVVICVRKRLQTSSGDAPSLTTDALCRYKAICSKCCR